MKTAMQPMGALQPAVALLASNLDILPATGGAVEELLQPDLDGIDAMLVNAESREVTEFLETPAPDPRSLYRSTPPIFRPERHRYRFLIDGSLRTYYLPTGIEGIRSFPVELAQNGADVMQRDERGSVKPLAARQRLLLLLLPRVQLGLSDTVDQNSRNAVTQAGHGELLISHAVYRQPVKVIFPRPAYRQEQS